MYILACLQVSEGKVDKATGLFYRALQHVPWAKVRHRHSSKLSYHNQFSALLHFEIVLAKSNSLALSFV